MNENNLDSFFPESNYTMPETSNYMKFNEGDNTFRVLSSAVIGFEYFKSDNKPVRMKTAPDTLPSDIKEGGAVKHFWAFVVYNYESKRIQILELTQKGIMKTMQSYIKNPKWGNPRDYDFIVTRTGSGMDTEYAITVNPKAPVEQSIVDRFAKMKIDLNALFTNDDPFLVNN